MNNYRYYRPIGNNAEAVEFDVVRKGKYVTTCVVNVQLLLFGIKTHPCGNGDDVKLTDHEMAEVLKVIKRERDAVKYSGELKTFEGWGNSGLNLGDYLAVGDEVDEALIDQQMGCVPPRNHRAGYMQVGEPYTDAVDDNGLYRPTYATFHNRNESGSSFWIYAGHCFAGEDVNRVPEKDVAGAMLKKFMEGAVV